MFYLDKLMKVKEYKLIDGSSRFKLGQPLIYGLNR